MVLLTKRGSSGGGNWYSEENTPERISYWGEKYGEQKPWVNKKTGETGETVKAKYYKGKTADELIGTRYGLEKLTKLAGEELPEPEKEKKSFLKRLGMILNSTAPAPVFLKALKDTKSGQGEVNPLKFAQKYGGEYLKNVGRGLAGTRTEEQDVGFKQVFDEMGWKPTSKAGKAARWTAGLAGDIALDPLTYVTAGVGKGATLGGKTLTKAGEKALKKNITELGAKEGTRVTKELLEKTPQWIKKGGIKFAGKTIVPEKAIKYVGKKTRLTDLKEGIRGSQPYQSVAKMFNRDVRPGGVGKEEYNKLTDMIQTELLDKKEYDQSKVLDYIGKIYKGTTPKERDELHRALLSRETTKMVTPKITKGQLSLAPAQQEITVKGLPKTSDKLAPAGKETTSMLGRLAKEDEIAKTRLNYVPQAYEDPIKAKQFIEGMGNKKGIKTIGGFEKARTIEQLSDIPRIVLGDKKMKEDVALDIIFKKKGKLANGMSYDDARKAIKEAGLTPKTDIAEVMAGRILESKGVKANKEFLSKIGKEFGSETGGKDFVTYQSKHVGEIKIPRWVASKVEDLEKQAINDDGLNSMIKSWQKVQNVYKLGLTSFFPAFHARNAISNVAQNFLDIGLSALNPKDAFDSIRALKGTNGVLKTKTGIKYTYKEVKELMKKHGITTEGFYDIEAETLLKSKLNKTLSKGKVKGAAKWLFNAPREAGGHIEKQARAVNFISNLKRGLEPEQAAKQTKKFLFDYGNLSNTEKKFFKSVFPFWTWSRKNLELQAKMLATAPGKISAEMKAVKSFGEPISEDEEKGVPEFIKKQLGVKSGTDKYGRPVYYAGLGLPIEEFAKNISDPKEALFNMLTPLAKTTIEAKTGQDLFREKPIEDIKKADDVKYIVDNLPIGDKGKQRIADFLDLRSEKKGVYANGKKVGEKTEWSADPQKLWALRQLPTSRLQTTLGYIGSEDMTDNQIKTKLFSGIKGYSVDEESQKYFANAKENKKLIDMLKRYGVVGQKETGQTYIKNEDKYLSQVLPNQNQNQNTYASALSKYLK